MDEQVKAALKRKYGDNIPNLPDLEKLPKNVDINAHSITGLVQAHQENCEKHCSTRNLA